MRRCQFIFNLPKSSDEQDKQKRHPGGGSRNGAGSRAAQMRGQPDVVKRVATPEGGNRRQHGFFADALAADWHPWQLQLDV